MYVTTRLGKERVSQNFTRPFKRSIIFTVGMTSGLKTVKVQFNIETIIADVIAIYFTLVFIT
jgi:hypothetical protein